MEFITNKFQTYNYMKGLILEILRCKNMWNFFPYFWQLVCTTWKPGQFSQCSDGFWGFPIWFWASQVAIPSGDTIWSRYRTFFWKSWHFSTHLCLGLHSGLFHLGFPTNILYAFLSTPFMLHTCPISSVTSSF
jgi:hypothetical protein